MDGNLAVDIDSVARLTIGAVITKLSEFLTTPVVARLSKAPSTKTVREWMYGRVPTRRRENILRFALQLSMIVSHNGDRANRASVVRATQSLY